MICLDKDDPYHHFVCSVDGCGSTPVYMAVMERGDNSPALLCSRHFEEAEDSIMSALGVPAWLTGQENFYTPDEEMVLDLVVEWEPDEEPVVASAEVPSDVTN
jgi:hypothetical protein